MKVLITGTRGSVAYYLREYLVERGDEVYSWGERPHEDLLDRERVITGLDVIRPEVIYHAAAIANVRASFEHPAEVIHNNVIGTVRLFEALQKLKLRPVVVLCSTSEVYGNATLYPIGEEWPIAPVNPYAVSKAGQEHVASMYGAMLGLPVVLTRAFGYINPRRPDLSLTSFARQIAEIEVGMRECLDHGNLSSLRSFCDVRDVVRAYCYAPSLPAGAYNIGSEEAITVGQCLEALISMSTARVITRMVPELVRPTDIVRAVPTCYKFRRATGWEPAIPFADSLRWLLNYQRARLAHDIETAGASVER